MIYEDLQSTFASLAGLFDALSRSLAELAKGLGSAPLSATVANISSDASSEIPLAQAAGSQVLNQGPIDATLAWGRLGIDATRQRVQNKLRNPFDLATSGLPQSGDLARCQDLLDQLEGSLAQALAAIDEAGTSPQGPAYNLGRLRSTVDDLASYPVLTSETSSYGGGGGWGAGSAPGSASSTGTVRLVDQTVRAVLGRLPRYTDARAFTAALASTFDVREEQGHTVTVWRPRGFVGQTDLGGTVSGIQASIYARAKEALDAVLPLLAALTPLRTDADVQEMDAARSIVESEFRAVVDELGTPGGPRMDRVDRLFATLLDDNVYGINNVVSPGGMVGYIGTVFGLDPLQVNTIEEDQVYSNYLLVKDYIGATRDSVQQLLGPSGGRDLGTLLVLLSNALQVVAESVDELRAALDSVFVGPAEQTVSRFTVGSGRTMLVSELLSWVSSFAVNEAPELVQQGGRRSMGAIESTTADLIRLVKALVTATAADPGLPVGMRHPRVRHPLDELTTYLRQVEQLAADVRAV